METLQPPKNAQSRTKEDRCRIMAKKKQIIVNEDGKHGQQRSAEEIEKKIPQDKSEDEKLTQNKRSRTEHKQLHTTKTGGRQDRARNTGNCTS